jgi:hypothetical protein
MEVVDISKVITAMKSGSLNDAVDKACEFGFTLGEISEKTRWLDALDKLENSLLESEEDAIMTIHLIRKMIENDERE